MIRFILVVFLFFLLQIIRTRSQYYLQTIAGNGNQESTGDDGPASLGTLNTPMNIWGDSVGSLFIAENNGYRIRCITSSFIITTFIGGEEQLSDDDGGPALSVKLLGAYGIYGDSNLLYYSDGSRFIWQYNSSNSIVTKIAGITVDTQDTGDSGPAIDAKFTPYGLFLSNDKNYLCFADPINNVIRYINLETNQITRFAGNGSTLFGGDGGPATSAGIDFPLGIWGNSNGIIYIADFNHNRIRKVVNGIISTFAGTGMYTYNGESLPATSTNLYGPSDVKGDTVGNIYVIEQYECRIRIISTSEIVQTIIGNGDCTPASTAMQLAYGVTIDASRGLWVDSKNDIYFTEQVGYVRKISYVSQMPSSQPTSRPSTQPTSQPINRPTMQPTSRPSSQPTNYPSSQPTIVPSSLPTSRPSMKPTSQPSLRPSSRPSCQPRSRPSAQPTSKPTIRPTMQPTSRPSSQPTNYPSSQTTIVPSSLPTSRPSMQPTSQPSLRPSSRPSCQPRSRPSAQPTSKPTIRPTMQPIVPSSLPTSRPSMKPTSQPSLRPSSRPSCQPRSRPSAQPTSKPTIRPTMQPTSRPSLQPTSSQKTIVPSSQPTSRPSMKPTSRPSMRPSSRPSCQPMSRPSAQPTSKPTIRPTMQPTSHPSMQPSSRPSCKPRSRPSAQPMSRSSSQPINYPSSQSTILPSSPPTSTLATNRPTMQPTFTMPFFLAPTFQPTTVFLTTDAPLPSVPFLSASPTFASPAMTLVNSNVSNWKEVICLVGVFFAPTVFELSVPLLVSFPTSGLGFILFGSRSLSSTVFSNATLPHNGAVLRQQKTIRRDTITQSSSIPGDLNHDGWNDLLLCNTITSICYIFFGTASGITNSVMRTSIIGTAATDYFGFSTSLAGNMNADKIPDVVICALSKRGCYVLYGRLSWGRTIEISQMTSADGYQIMGERSTLLLGISVTGLGDMNGDGYDDVAISAITSISSSTYVIYVIYGSGKGETVLLSAVENGVGGFRITGEAGYYTGLSISGIGDVNEDGFTDLAIGKVPFPGSEKAQSAMIIFGSSVGEDILLSSNRSSEWEGRVLEVEGGGFIVSGIGDVNHDGIADVLLTAFDDYIGKGNAYIVTYPSDVTSSPSLRPSSSPSSSPTSMPSSKPSTFSPTHFPSSRSSNPSEYSSSSAPSFSISPSNVNSTLIPSKIPTHLLPSHRSIKPTIPPTFVNTRLPTKTLFPSEKPSIRPSTHPSHFVTKLPTQRPSYRPSCRSAASNPSLQPSSVSSFISNENNVTITITTEGHYVAISGGREIFEVKGSGAIGIDGGAEGNIYVIYPPSSAANRTVLTISNFNIQRDLIDLRHILTIHSVNDISFLDNPLTMDLTKNVKVICSSLRSTEPQRIHFIFSASVAESSNGQDTTASLIAASSNPSVIVAMIILCICFLFVFAGSSRCSTNNIDATPLTLFQKNSYNRSTEEVFIDDKDAQIIKFMDCTLVQNLDPNENENQEEDHIILLVLICLLKVKQIVIAYRVAREAVIVAILVFFHRSIVMNQAEPSKSNKQVKKIMINHRVILFILSRSYRHQGYYTEIN